MAQNGKRTVDTSETALAEVARTAQLVWRLLLDSRVSVIPKLLIPLIFTYVIFPLDLDFIPFLGYMDDVAVVFFGVKFFIQMCPPEVVMEHRRALVGENPKAPDYVDTTYRYVDEDKR